MDTIAAKTQLRRQLRARRAGLGAAVRARASAAIAARVLATPWVTGCGTVGLYAPRDAEVDTAAIAAGLRAGGARVCYPRVRRDARSLEFVPVAATAALAPGFAGIPEPAGAALPLPALDALLLPCVGVDAAGFRLGAGGGYYDRTLAGYAGPCLGLAFAVQRVPLLPRDAWDRSMDGFACEDGLTACPRVGPP